jgi:hypothetical protein
MNNCVNPDKGLRKLIMRDVCYLDHFDAITVAGVAGFEVVGLGPTGRTVL